MALATSDTQRERGKVRERIIATAAKDVRIEIKIKIKEPIR